MRVAALLISAVTVARRSLGWLAARAVDRAITPGSLSGISVLMALCAAGWFIGGAGQDGARGLLAMCGWMLFLLASRGLAGFAAGRMADGRAEAGYGGTDWLVLPATWPGGGQEAAARKGAQAAGPAPGQFRIGAGDEATGDDAPAGARLGFGWLAAVSAIAAESAIYGGMAAGIAHSTLIGAWPLAVLAVSSVALTDVFGACRAAAMAAGRDSNPVLRAVGRLLRVPPALRGWLALAAYGLGGPQAALLSVFGLGVVAMAAAVATIAMVVPAAEEATATATRATPGRKAAAPRSGGGAPPRITAIVGVQGSQGETTAVQFTTTPSPAWLAAGRNSAARSQSAARQETIRRDDTPPGRTTGRRAAGRAAAPAPERGDVILALRDDGAAARWAGRLVQGNLIPLPPALAGLIATAMLAALGLHHLLSFIALTPPVVMMLAAPGSSHPHDRRFDWVVPALLAAAQFVYLGSLGFALAVPGPVVFGSCAVVAIWYASTTAIAAGTRLASQGTGQDLGTGLGWETRMFVVGLASTFGLATFGYVVLAAYLGVLICRKVVTGYLVPREEDRP